jgi:4-diphosphocytidyl-2-C-methyl-D-erythritol kinase
LHIGTAEAYAGVKPAPAVSDLEMLVTSQAPSAWKGCLMNDFEHSIFLKYPQLASIKEMLYARGAVYASMTGSGSAVYALFEQETKIAGQFEDVFVWEEMLN